MSVFAGLMGIVGIGLQLFGGITAAEAERDKAAANKKYYDALAKTSEKQATFFDVQAGQYEQQALGATDVGEQNVTLSQNEGLQGLKTVKEGQRQTEGAQRAAIAASGGDVSSVTSQDIALDTMTRAELDKETIRYNADLKSWEQRKAAKAEAYQLRAAGANAGFQAGQLRDQASSYRLAGIYGVQAGNLAATSATLTTVGTTAARTAELSRYIGKDK